MKSFRLYDKVIGKMYYSGFDSFPSYKIWLNGAISQGDTWCTGDCELMQFTGRKDDEGKKIWEGDIVQIYGGNALVFFRLGSFCIYFDKGLWLELSQFSGGVKVIGNKYENPELTYLYNEWKEDEE